MKDIELRYINHIRTFSLKPLAKAFLILKKNVQQVKKDLDYFKEVYKRINLSKKLEKKP